MLNIQTNLLLLLISVLWVDHVRADVVVGAVPRLHRRRHGHGGQNDCFTKNVDCDVRRPGSIGSLDRANAVYRGGGGGGFKGASVPSSPPRATKKQLQSMRLLYLTYYASLGALLPYLPVYYHSLGHPGSSIGLLGAVKPLTTFLVAPLWGVLSDAASDQLSILQFTFISSLVFQLLVGMNSSLNYLIATVFAAAALNAPVKSLVDALVLGKLTNEKDRHQFGKMRLWGQLGFGAGSSLVGSLMSAFPADRSDGQPAPSAAAAVASDPPAQRVVHNVEVGASVLIRKAYAALEERTRDLIGRARPLEGYEWAFLTHAILSVPVFFCMRAFRQDKSKQVVLGEKKKQPTNTNEVKEKKSNIGEGLRLLGKNSDALIFFFLVFVIGTSSGCVENFAYVRVREVGGTGNHMGVLRLVSSLAGAPMFWFSGPMTDALGTDVVLALSLFAYVARFFNYAWMSHPYHALPAEALRGITFAAFWSSGSTYAHKISPPGMNATMLLIMNAMYGGLGQSLGAIIGGKLQSRFGTVKTFVYSGIFDMCFVGALVAYLASVKERAFSTLISP